MKRILNIIITILIGSFQGFAQINPALGLSEYLCYNARFKSADTRQIENLKNLKLEFLVTNLKTDTEKNAFWVNIYNSYMLTFLRDTMNEGVYTNFYKKKNITIAGKDFSLFDIEHEFIRLGKKNKILGFKKSKLNNDTSWRKLRPEKYNDQTILLMYRGLYGYPPFQVIENGNIDVAYKNSLVLYGIFDSSRNNKEIRNFDWLKPYKIALRNPSTEYPLPLYKPTPFAVHINNFYPRYEPIKFK
jgi:hypothetical protein